MQKRESSGWHVCDSFLLNFHNCNSMVPFQWSMIEEWKKIKSRSRDFQFLFLGAKKPFKSIGLMIVSIKRLMIRSNRHGAPVLPRQRIEGDYHHCNLHLSCLQEPAAHLCSSKMDGNWTFHCWTVFKWLTDVKLLNTYKETVAWSRIVDPICQKIDEWKQKSCSTCEAKTLNSHLHLLYQPLFHLKWIYCSATLYNYMPFDPISSEEISKDLWVK